MRALRFGRKSTESRFAADLQTQVESVLDSVWQAEKSWRLMDQIDLAVAFEERRLRRLREGAVRNAH